MNNCAETPAATRARLRPWHILVLSAIMFAVAMTARSPTDSLPDRIVRTEAERALPSIAEELQDETPELNLLFLNYAPDRVLWMSASLAVLRHGDVAREVLLEYGMLDEFQDVLTRFGSDVVLPIHFFRANDIGTLRARAWVGNRLDRIKAWFSNAESVPDEVLTPYRRGLFAIALLDQHGHGLLDQFAVNAQSEVLWLQGERVVSVVGDFFTSGLRDLEGQWRRGEDVGVGDVGWAGLDLLVMAGSIKLLRAGKAAGMTRTSRAVGQGRMAAGARFASLGNAARVSALVGLGYLAVRHPGLISAAGTTLADWMGWPAWAGQFLVWFVVLLPVLWLLRLFVFWLLLPFCRLVAPAARACAAAVSGRRIDERGAVALSSSRSFGN